MKSLALELISFPRSALSAKSRQKLFPPAVDARAAISASDLGVNSEPLVPKVKASRKSVTATVPAWIDFPTSIVA